MMRWMRSGAIASIGLSGVLTGCGPEPLPVQPCIDTPVSQGGCAAAERMLRIFANAEAAPGKMSLMFEGAHGALTVWKTGRSGFAEALFESIDGTRSRVLTEHGTHRPLAFVDDTNGDYTLVLRDEDAGVIVFATFDDSDVYTTGYVVWEHAGTPLVGELVGTAVYSGQLTGELSSLLTEERGSFAVVGDPTDASVETMETSLGDLHVRGVQPISDAVLAFAGTYESALAGAVIEAEGEGGVEDTAPIAGGDESETVEDVDEKVAVVSEEFLFRAGILAIGLDVAPFAKAGGWVGAAVALVGPSLTEGYDPVIDQTSLDGLPMRSTQKDLLVAAVADTPFDLTQTLVAAVERGPVFEEASSTLIAERIDAVDERWSFELTKVSLEAEALLEGGAETTRAFHNSIGPSDLVVRYVGSGTWEDGRSFSLTGSAEGDEIWLLGETDDEELVTVSAEIDPLFSNVRAGTFTLGEEEGDVSGNLTPVSPCQTVSPAGVSAASSLVHDVGYGSGKVQFSWSANTLGERFEVRTRDTSLFSSGYVTGAGSTSFDVPAEGSAEVWVQVSGPYGGTTWSYDIGCLEPTEEGTVSEE